LNQGLTVKIAASILSSRQFKPILDFSISPHSAQKKHINKELGAEKNYKKGLGDAQSKRRYEYKCN